MSPKNKKIAEVKPRNTTVLNPLLRKSHAHDEQKNSSKSKRAKAKRELSKELQKGIDGEG